MKRALIVGIDNYRVQPLRGCVYDATAVTNILEKNGDGSPNFSVRKLISSDMTVDGGTLQSAVEDLFKGEAETVLLYFSGHGLINQETNAGYIVSQDGKKSSWGVALADILFLANESHPRIKSSVIILDSCHSGTLGEVPIITTTQSSVIGNGVTILTACHRSEEAAEIDGHGLFTSMLLDGLQGGAADICGRITPASVYSHIDQTLGPWEQRPVYKANVQTFITLREVSPKVPLDVLRRLPTYFEDPNKLFPLEPSYEPDRENVPDEFKHIPVDDKKVKIFKELQSCNRVGLVVPAGTEHMYYAAIYSKSCRLTALGKHYRKLAELNRI